MPPKIYPTQNVEWGFFGTCRKLYLRREINIDPKIIWDAAFVYLSDLSKEWNGKRKRGNMIRDYLDSVSGRHYADYVTDGICEGDLLSKCLSGYRHSAPFNFLSKKLLTD